MERQNTNFFILDKCKKKKINSKVIKLSKRHAKLGNINPETQEFLYKNINKRSKNTVKPYKSIEAQSVTKLSGKSLSKYNTQCLFFLVFYKLLDGATDCLKVASDIDVWDPRI